MYSRLLKDKIAAKFGRGKAIMLIGPRQVGKTTLIKEIIEDQEFLFLDGDDPEVRKLMTLPNTEKLRSIIGTAKVVFIDEAQRIEGIGLTSKIITDQFKDVQLIISGSSSFDLNNQLNEPLTGRKWEYNMLPISWEEYQNKHGYLVAEQQLENRMLYGFYPDVLNHPGEEREILNTLVSSYLYRDILAFSGIRKPETLEKLLQAIALQVGSEVNYNELALMVGVDKNTISKYIDILQQGFVLFKLGSFSRNIRNEIKSNKKIYFYDNGVRNMILGDFSPLDMRMDKGALWENFLIAERVKQNLYKETYAKTYFWRSKQQQEVDFVEEKNGKIDGFEFKWKSKPSTKLPKTFVEGYNATQTIIDRENFRDFVYINS
jgi:predicted AAA+ superfamily ATPase